MKATLLLILIGVASVCAAQATSTNPVPPPAAKAESPTAKVPAPAATVPPPAAKAPLPAQLLSAKSLCIKAPNASEANVAEARKELNAWGRFQVKEDCAQSDVALWIIVRVLPQADICGAVIQVTGNADPSILWTGNLKCKRSDKGLVGRLVRALRNELDPPVRTKRAKSKSKT
jgi:hypothetical protein